MRSKLEAKFVAFATLLSLAAAGLQEAPTPLVFEVQPLQQKQVVLPYSFGYQLTDTHSDQHRHEKSDGLGTVQGSYGYTDAWGHFRQVDYVADKWGFRAKVHTNEPGTASKHPAHVQMNSGALQKH
ncbi:cuticle protein 10.9-like [Ornithodoros turicata]|uniref:cuticle protein 10.9-like n=1 Tax=Ornithodoros turicata TaxID=34597 RepID=UPI0031396EB6